MKLLENKKDAGHFNAMLTDPVRIPSYRRRRPTSNMRPMLDLWRPTSWRVAVANVAAVRLPPEVIVRIRNIPAERMFADTMRFLDQALDGYRRDSFDIELRQLELAVLERFKTLRAFHGCKPISVKSYLEKGILPLTREWLAQEAFDLFEGKIPRAEIDRSVAEADLDCRLGKIFFCTDPKDLIAEAGRYLAYGPESICCAYGDNAARFYEARERQRARGIPTMFECAVPLALLSDDWAGEVAREILTAYFQELSVEPHPDPDDRDFCIGIDATLPPRNILGHFHPAVIEDLHNPLNLYINSKRRCPHC